MNKTDEKLLNNVLDNNPYEADSYNIRKNGKSIDRKINPYVNIISKEDGSGIDIYVKENTLLSYTNNEGVSVDFTADDLLLNYFDSQLSTSNQQLYDIVYEALVKKYFSLESNQTAYQEIMGSTDSCFLKLMGLPYLIAFLTVMDMREFYCNTGPERMFSRIL